MKEINCEILVVGSGLIGLVAAHSLSSLNFKVALVDKKNFSDPNMSFQDNRTVAISEGSKQFLEHLYLWSDLKGYAEPIKKIKVFDRSPKNKIEFKNSNTSQNLGYVIENKIFSKILIDKLNKFKKIKKIYGFDVSNVEYERGVCKVSSEKYTINSKLLVAADGKNSKIKNIIGTKTYKKVYPDNALVITFEHEKNINNTAYEIFYKTGPIAILPMNSKKGFKSTVIWSNNKNVLNKLVNSNSVFLKNYVEEKIGDYVGHIKKISSFQVFPLSAHLNDSFYGNRLIYIGDSAHSIHPIAGQGWNLGVTDVKNLYKISKSLRGQIGTTSFCKEYNDLTYNKAFQLYQITDKLNSHFKKNNLLYRQLSNIGFNFIENTRAIKNKISKYAMAI